VPADISPELYNLLIAALAIVPVTLFIIILFREPKEKERVYDEIRSAGSQEGDTDEKRFLLLAQYHAAGLSQSKISFWFSLVFAAIGFVVIIMPIVRNAEDIQVVNLVSGAVIEAVAGLFFVQSNRARQLMVDFFDKLRADRKLENALEMANKTDDVVLRGRLKALIALEFAGVRANPDESVLATALKQDGFLAALLDVEMPERSVRKVLKQLGDDVSDSTAQSVGQVNGAEEPHRQGKSGADKGVG
jgi:hypothetical protein